MYGFQIASDTWYNVDANMADKSDWNQKDDGDEEEEEELDETVNYGICQIRLIHN